MKLFTRNRKQDVRNFILKLVNNNCPELEALIDGPRLEGRVPMVVVVLVVPIENKRPRTGQLFTAITKEFSSSGLSLVLDEPRGLDEVILGFRWESRMKFVRAKAMHLNPIGGGFYQLGFGMSEVVQVGDYPELQNLHL